MPVLLKDKKHGAIMAKEKIELSEIEALKKENQKLKKQIEQLKSKNKVLQHFYDNAPGGGKYEGNNFGNDFSW